MFNKSFFKVFAVPCLVSSTLPISVVAMNIKSENASNDGIVSKEEIKAISENEGVSEEIGDCFS